MNVFGSTDAVLLNIGRNQRNEADNARRLASGLRIESAADDPSGLAISEQLKSRISGFQQAVSNVQTANNALTVGDGALATAIEILQRIRSLVVESRADINSAGDLQSIQSEIDQLLLEVNRVGQNTNFNGRTLLDGSYDTSAGQAATLQQIPAMPNASGATGPTQLVNADGAGNPGPFLTGASANTLPGQLQPGILELQITAYSNNPTDPTTGIPLGGPGVFLEQDMYSTAPAFGSAPEEKLINALPVNAGPGGGGTINSPGGLQFIQFNGYGNITQQDVGFAIAYEVVAAKAAGQGHALEVNDGGQEGSTAAISLPTLSTGNLNVSGISVLAPKIADFTNTVTGQDSSNQLSALDAEFRVDNAIQYVLGARAQLGAQIVSLNYDAQNGSVAATNLTASQSSITDANIGATVTQFTKEQILTQVGNSVLSQMQVSAAGLTRLLIGAHVA